MSITPTYIDSQFLGLCKRNDRVMTCFKVVASYDAPADNSDRDTVLNFYANNISPENPPEVYQNPWYYFPVHIEDDIITVKISGEEIANRSYLWFICDIWWPDVTEVWSNRLAFYVNVTQGTNKLLENDQENCFSFSFKKLTGIQCRFETFDKYDDDHLNPQPLGETNNVFRITPTEHRHSNNELADINDKIYNTLDLNYGYISAVSYEKFDLWTKVEQPFAPSGTRPFLLPDGSHYISSQTITHNQNWIQNLGVSKLFYDDTTIATQEDELMLVTNGF